MGYKYLGLFLISTFLFGEISYVVGDDGRIRSGGYCESDPTCVCIFNNERIVIHCENDFHLFYMVGPGRTDPAVIVCNVTLTSTKMNRDYYSLLRLNHYKIPWVRFIRCPEPTGSYASLFLPPQASLSPHEDTFQPENTFSNLGIACDTRSDYSIAKKNLEGLSRLSHLDIDCPALTSLPNDLFHGTTPNLKTLKIINTRLGHIPGSLFSYAPTTPELIENREGRLQVEEKTLPHLETLILAWNNVTFLEDDIFESFSNLRRLSLEGNNISTLPKSLRNVTDLTELDLQNNSLKKLEEQDCAGFSNLTKLILVANLITNIDPKCFSLMKRVVVFDISGNALTGLPDFPLHMNPIFGNFAFNDNSGGNIHIKKFATGVGLQDLSIRNSAVISIHPDTLIELPGLMNIDLSLNMIPSLPEGLFSSNQRLVSVNLSKNMLSTLPADIFQSNPRLTAIYLSHNKIEHLYSTFLANIREIEKLDLSNNALREIPHDVFSNVSQINYLNISTNKITSLHKDLFQHVYEIKVIDLSYNLFQHFSRDVLSPFDGSDQVEYLHLRGNILTDIPNLSLPALKYLDLGENALEYIPAGIFHNLSIMKQLDLSKNSISNMENYVLVTYEQKLEHLDLSSNQLKDISITVFSEAENLEILKLSNNKIDDFSLDCLAYAKKIIELDLSSNGMTSIGIYGPYYHQCSYSGMCKVDPAKFPVKILNLSNNSLSFNDTEWEYDEGTETWGKVSPLYHFSDAEIILLNDNLIETIFLDWRVIFGKLKLLDLRRNNFRYLTRQDLLFSTSKFNDNNPYIHSLTVDLRENKIKGVDLPSSNLRDVPSRFCIDKAYGHATLLLDDNPFLCGCGLLNLLKVLDHDVVLISEFQRTHGQNFVMPAKFEVGNLSCWEPTYVRGKKISEPETFIHHLLPMYGLCVLDGHH